MKKQIFTFLLGGLTFLCIGAGVATSTEILTVKPATPKLTRVIHLSSNTGAAHENRVKIIELYEQGYILKSGWYEHGKGSLIVMEKY